MNFKIKANFDENLNTILQECGYRLHPKYGDSYIRSISREFYPRWHLYIKNNNDIIEFSIHIDQKKVSYKGTTAHSGEYDDAIIKDEAKRIISFLSKHVVK
jgi:hypothetical protein